MREELVEELVILVEEYINELEDETVTKTGTARIKNYEKAVNDYAAAEPGTPERTEASNKAAEAGKKLDNFKKLRGSRDARKREMHAKVEAFRNYLMEHPTKAKEIKKAGDDHVNAIITQWRRNKLEKSVKV